MIAQMKGLVPTPKFLIMVTLLLYIKIHVIRDISTACDKRKNQNLKEYMKIEEQQ